MQGIYLAEIITTGIAAAIFVPVIHRLKMPANEWLVWLAAALALPMEPLAFYLVRVPLDVAHLDSTSATYQWVTSFYAPLTEEPAKLLPLLIPAIRRDLGVANF